MIVARILPSAAEVSERTIDTCHELERLQHAISGNVLQTASHKAIERKTQIVLQSYACQHRWSASNVCAVRVSRHQQPAALLLAATARRFNGQRLSARTPTSLRGRGAGVHPRSKALGDEPLTPSFKGDLRATGREILDASFEPMFLS